ncbi:Aste57867_12980 [Aphanomyces stellatus]|uniref:Aste57867_12980 protein n=1 Tax=Aphanomyces stellatus TaxID=120398 RepID=A0A485KXV6_9STRA|nr:hypothetical protein As57867_012932 [Aphanomyces stellatus]VFT89826.1 Aste57867_12980 [Aphanomyces stellatus]
MARSTIMDKWRQVQVPLLARTKKERRRKEKEFVAKHGSVRQWLKVAAHESHVGNPARAREAFERAVVINGKDPLLWIRYAEMEAKYNYADNARHVWERALEVHRGWFQLWRKYTRMEERTNTPMATLALYERWMLENPVDEAWYCYMEWEMRSTSVAHVRAVLERYVRCHPTARAFIKYATWEESQKHTWQARDIYARAHEQLAPTRPADETLYVAFAAFELRQGEIERARGIYKFVLNRFKHVSPSPALRRIVQAFEEKHGDPLKWTTAAQVRLRRDAFEFQLAWTPKIHDSWLQYIDFAEKCDVSAKTLGGLYDRSLGHTPVAGDTASWRSYAALWVRYAKFLEARVSVKAAEIQYTACLRAIRETGLGPLALRVSGIYAEYLRRQNQGMAARALLEYAASKGPRRTPA